ncbi:MAG: peptidoglycan-binding protein [Patescibacteria group bacterium]
MKQLSLLVLMSLFLPTVVLGAYNDVSLTTGTTLQVTVGGTALGLTVTNGTVEKVVVEGSTLGITLAGGSSIDLTSADKYTFSYAKSNAIVGETCGSSSSSLGISLAAGQTTETVSVSPTTTICQTSASGSGSSSSSSDSSSSSSSSSSSTSSSSSSSTATVSTATTAITASTPAVVASVPVTTTAPSSMVVSTPVTTVSTSPAIKIDSELNPGARNDEVMDLQKLLAKDPEIYPEGTVSGFYGPKTTAAVKKFQAKYGLPTVGRVGPATMAKLNEVLGVQMVVTPTTPSTTASVADQIQTQIQTIQSQIQSLTSGTVVGSVSVNSELNPGARNDEVMDLQKLLAKDPEIYPEGTVSGFYGPKTTAAVKKFQAKYGLPTVGRVGPATMAKLNEVLGVSVAMPTVPEAPSYTAPTVNSSTDATKQIEDQIKAIQDQIKVLTAPVAAPVKPVASPSVVPSTTSSSDIAKQVEDQIKAIQAQIDALLKQ